MDEYQRSRAELLPIRLLPTHLLRHLPHFHLLSIRLLPTHLLRHLPHFHLLSIRLLPQSHPALTSRIAGSESRVFLPTCAIWAVNVAGSLGWRETSKITRLQKNTALMAVLLNFRLKLSKYRRKTDNLEVN